MLSTLKKSSKCFATEWEMCLPHLKAGVRIDAKINFSNPVCCSILTELLSLLQCHVLVRGKQKVPFGYGYLSVVLWGKTCVSILPEYLCEQDDRALIATFHKFCVTWCCRAVAGILQATPVAGL